MITITHDSILRDGKKIADYDPEKNVIRSEKRLAPFIMGEIGQEMAEKPKYEFGSDAGETVGEALANLGEAPPDPKADQAGPVNPAPTIGRIIRFVGKNGRGQVVERPGVIVAVNENGTCNLQVFMDGNGGHYNDGTLPVVWHQNVVQSEGPEEGRFYFPKITR